MTDGAIFINKPSTVVFPQEDGKALVLVPQGPSGAAASIDLQMEFEDFVASQTLAMSGPLARPFPATAAASLAYTETPPLSAPVTVGLLNNGSQFGTATWGIGETYGVLTWTGPAPFVRESIPGAHIPSDADTAFTQLCITFAGP